MNVVKSSGFHRESNSDNLVLAAKRRQHVAAGVSPQREAHRIHKPRSGASKWEHYGKFHATHLPYRFRDEVSNTFNHIIHLRTALRIRGWHSSSKERPPC